MAQLSTPLPASTVVLARPDNHGAFEIFMNRRPEKMDTYAGVYVFPGGRVEEGDWSPPMLSLVHGVTPDEAQRALGSQLQPEVCLGYWVAAVRELFEETGIQFFIPQSSATAPSDRSQIAQRLSEKRPELQEGKFDFPSLIASQQLFCDVARLTYFYHRITPEHYPVRFDTRFYLAALPLGQNPLHSSEEVSESLWIAPQAAIDRSQTGNFPMMPPTVAVLRTLAAHTSWKALRDAFQLR